MSEDFDFDAIKAQADKNVEQAKADKAAGKTTENKSIFRNWTKGPLIAGGIAAVIIIAGFLIFAFVL